MVVSVSDAGSRFAWIDLIKAKACGVPALRYIDRLEELVGELENA